MRNANSTSRIGRLGRHLRRNLVSYIALVVALTMTPIPSQAVGSLIGTSDIKNGAVTAKKIATGAVKNVKIRDGAVSSTKLAPNSVTGAKIADGSVGSADLAAGSVKATKLGTIVERDSGNVQIAAGTGGSASVSCAAGETLLSGGNGTQGVGTGNNFWIIRSQKSGANSWEVVARNQTAGAVGLFAIAYCLQ